MEPAVVSGAMVATRSGASSSPPPLLVERLVLALNGRRYEVAAAELEPSTTLLEFIRTRTPFRGPKLGCGEGAPPSSQTLSQHKFLYYLIVLHFVFP
jgi:abscisic-aldehyde oxidase